MEPRIELTGVSLTYPRTARDVIATAPADKARHVCETDEPTEMHQAVQAVSLTITAGQRIGIIGRNGAGKSSLLSLIAGLIRPTSGEVSVQGQVTAVMTLGIGLREDFSGRDNIYLDGQLQSKSRAEIERSMEEIIAFADIGEFIDYPLRTYSTGMKARLAFSMIINLEPEILVIDETLAVGDIDFVTKSSRKIREICERGKIVILVSHSMASIVNMCSRCLWLDNGRVLMDGDPATVTAAYVDTVHREDETRLLDRFCAHIGNKSYRGGFEIVRLELFDPTVGDARAVLRAEDSLSIRAQLKIATRLSRADVLIRIVRLDGLVLTENRLSERDSACRFEAPGTYTIEAYAGRCVLASGIYEVILELLDGEERLAEGSTIFDVKMPDSPVGGRPALNYPWSVASARQPAA
jgi:lipopolysaccharide transport system ATP-binding protein